MLWYLTFDSLHKQGEQDYSLDREMLSMEQRNDYAFGWLSKQLGGKNLRNRSGHIPFDGWIRCRIFAQGAGEEVAFVCLVLLKKKAGTWGKLPSLIWMSTYSEKSWQTFALLHQVFIAAAFCLMQRVTMSDFNLIADNRLSWSPRNVNGAINGLNSKLPHSLNLQRKFWMSSADPGSVWPCCVTETGYRSSPMSICPNGICVWSKASLSVCVTDITP